MLHNGNQTHGDVGQCAERGQFQPNPEWDDRTQVAPAIRTPIAAAASRSGLRVISNPTASTPSFR